MQSFLVAVAFLTVLPVRFRKLPAPEVVAGSRFWYPAVGLLLGAALGGGAALLDTRCRPPVAAFLVLAAWVLLTGALHLDGFCDLCDGLFAGRTREDRLRILKDPRLGTFGLAGGVLLLVGKFALLTGLLAAAPGRAPWVIAAAVTAARCLALCLAAGARYPRPHGTGKALVEATRTWEGGLFAALAAAVAFPALSPVRALPVFLAVLGLKGLCERRLGGVTGDCLGAAIELAELLFLLAAVL